jgi:hypothetical protein
LRLFSDEKNRPPLNGFKKGLDVYFVGGFLGEMDCRTATMLSDTIF